MNDCPQQPKDPFDLASEMEDHLLVIRDLAVALTHFSEGMEPESASAVQRLGWLAKDHCAAAEELRSEIFHLTHRARYQQRGQRHD